MIPPRTIGHGEISPDTVLMPTTDRAPKVLVIPTNSKSSKHYPEESLGAKLIACKEHKKWCKKIVDNPMLYLEECQHQILPEEHQPEIHSLRFFGPGAERATIEILAIIDWAAEFVKIGRSPVPEIPGFLRRPFIKGKLVKHPIPDDLAESIHKEKCVWTKAQKAWTYLYALLQFWTDQATTESGDVMYGGRRRPANLMIARIRATLNPSFRDHFQITWASIAVSTSWTQAHLYFGESDRERFRTEPGPTADLQSPLESAVEERWERYLKEGVLETPDLSFSTLSWAGAESMPLLLSEQSEARQLMEARHSMEADSVPPGFARIHRKAPEEQEATRYETPADSKQSIDEELGIQDVTNITEDWYANPNRNWRLPSKVFSNQWRWMNPQKNLLGCPMRKPLMCWGRTRDPAPQSQPQKTGSLIHLVDSPELQEMEDQSLDPWPAPPADGLQDTPQRDRC